jgi:SNF2 family DNA or RNA helicase
MLRKLPVPYLPHPYQEAATDWLILHSGYYSGGGAALFLNMGLGKTASTLMAFKKLKDLGEVKTMLIIAPLRVAQTTWPNEIEKWAEFSDLTYVVLHGGDKHLLLNKKADIYIINYEGIDWLTYQNWHGTDILCFDELTRMKNWSAQRVKAIKPFLPLFRRRWGLTGTPAPNGVIDLFSQVYMLDIGKRFGHRITKYRDTYFAPLNKYTHKYEPYKDSIAKIYDKIKDLAFSIEGKDWIAIPDELHNTIELKLPQVLRNDYNTLKKDCILELESMEVVTAVNAAALTQKLRQFLSGEIYVNKIATHIHTVKLDALKEFIEDMNGNPLLIAYQYNHELARFKETFKNAVFIEKRTDAKTLKNIIFKWNAGEIPVLFGHPASVGHGLNLQEACNNVLFYSLDFNLENFLQFIKRVARQGQKQNHVMIHYLTFSGTLDTYVRDVLIAKDDVQNTLLDFLKVDI